MKKILLLIFIIVAVAAYGFNNRFSYKPEELFNQTKDSVYICNSSGAYAYHSTPYCKGIQRCTHGIIKISLKDAIYKYNRRPCKIRE